MKVGKKRRKLSSWGFIRRILQCAVSDSLHLISVIKQIESTVRFFEQTRVSRSQNDTKKLSLSVAPFCGMGIRTRACLINSGLHKWREIFSSDKAIFRSNTCRITRKSNTGWRKKIRQLGILSFIKQALVSGAKLALFPISCGQKPRRTQAYPMFTKSLKNCNFSALFPW